MDNLSIGLTFLAGLLSFASPCVLPLVPAYVSYMGGRMTHTVALQIAGKSETKIGVSQRANMLLHGVTFVLGFTVVFVVIGLMTTAFVSVLGSAATVFKDVLGRAGGVLIIFFGLHFMGAWRWLFATLRARPVLISTPLTTAVFALLAGLLIAWAFIEWVLVLPLLAALGLWLALSGGFSAPQTFWTETFSSIENAIYNDTRRETRFSNSHGLSGSFLMGVVFSAGWTPCIGPIYGSVLTLAAQTGDAGAAMPLLVAYSFGLGVPFLLAALLLDGMQGFLKKLQRHMRKIELGSGTLLVFMGLMVASGQLQRLTQVLGNDFAEFTYRLEECGVGVFNDELAFNQLGDCLAGKTTIVALNQGSNVTLNAETSKLAYVLHLDEPLSVDVEIWNVSDASAALTFALHDAAGVLVASSSTLHALDNGRFVTLPSTALAAARYTLTVGAQSDVSFRVRVRAAQPLTNSTPNATVLDTSAMPSDSVGSISALSSGDTAKIGLEVGNIAPSFSVITLDGETLELAALRGRVVVLNFWGTWCAPCRREMPDLQAIHAAYGTDNVVVLGLAVRDSESAVRAFREEFGISFALALDEGEKLAARYAVVGQPNTVVIGKDGRIVQQFFSVISHNALKPVIESALNGS